ncbi:MAG TPA: acyl-CoA dehydrogenase family protein [Acidobacteriota bacterium]|nr:acyl-CoA dehydrogenase family protein [Acidobacteriota bacterium]
MDFDLTEEQRLLCQTVAAFTKQEIDPFAERIDRENRLPDGLIKKMAGLRLSGMILPEAYGGAGAGSLDCVLAIEQLSRSGTGAWWLAAFNNSIPESILRFGTERQRLMYLPPVCGGDAYASIQFTEPGTGSDPVSLTTTAIPDGDYFVINGEKRFSTFGAREGFAVLYAKDDSGRCTAFIADKNRAGYTAGAAYELMGSGGIEAVDVVYDNYRLPAENILGLPGKGMAVLLSWIANEKIQQCGACLGIAAAALDDAVAYSLSRKIRDRRQADQQGIRWMLAEMKAKLNAARWVTYRTALLKNNDAPGWMDEAASAKIFVVPAAMEIVELSLRIHGAYGYTKEFRIERLYRAVAGASVIAVGLEINKSIVGASLL